MMYIPPSGLGRRKTCSAACRAAYEQSGLSLTCALCGRTYKAAPSRRSRWCSRVCYEEHRQPRKLCAICAMPLRKNALTYCSAACSVAGRTTRVPRPCAVCGQEIQIQPHALAERSTCSRACAGRSKRLTGPGARRRRADGYVIVYYPSHPDATKHGWIMEHRLVMERQLSRRLLRTEQVNHINHIRDDNRPENLELLTAAAHARESINWGMKKRRTMRDRLAEYERRFGPLE